MANKTIPELPEIELVDLDIEDLLILETAIQTYKLRMETMLAFMQAELSFPVTTVKKSVVFDGITTGDKNVDVSADVADARDWQWMLKKPEGGSTLGEQILLTILTPDADTVRLNTGDFALDAGTYTLLGTGGM